MKANEVPVLLITFNRADTLARVLSVLKKVGVSRLYVAQDAPRANKPADEAKTKAVRDLIEAIDWQCEVKTHFQSDNQGCMHGPHRALDWFFSQVEEGIVLEDDCLPHPDFFGYCAELLEKYRLDTRVMAISGDRSPLPPNLDFQGRSYGFSRFSLIWGWASWRRAWKTYDLELKSWPEVRDSGRLKGLFRDEDVYNSLYDTFEGVHSGRHVTTWDYQWTYNCLFHSGLSIIPSKNLISNLGFGTDSTHTADASSPRAEVPTEPLLPLIHPEMVFPWNDLDLALLKDGLGFRKKPLWRKLAKRLLPSPPGRRTYHEWD